MIEEDELIELNPRKFFTAVRKRNGKYTITRSKLLKMIDEQNPGERIRRLEERLTNIEKNETIRSLKRELAILKKKHASTDKEEDEPKVKKPKKEVKSEDEEEQSRC